MILNKLIINEILIFRMELVIVQLISFEISHKIIILLILALIIMIITVQEILWLQWNIKVQQFKVEKIIIMIIIKAPVNWTSLSKIQNLKKDHKKYT